jgi:hypothetical protein
MRAEMTGLQRGAVTATPSDARARPSASGGATAFAATTQTAARRAKAAIVHAVRGTKPQGLIARRLSRETRAGGAIHQAISVI